MPPVTADRRPSRRSAGSPAPGDVGAAGAAGAASGAEVFEAERARLLGLAYRMLGTFADAEDVVQDAWLRWAKVDRAAVENPAAWLTTTVARRSLDRLRARRRDRATYVGPWLPEPVVVADRGDAVDPAERAVRAESLSLGFLHLLERLSPRERVAFVLTEVFDEPHDRAGAAVGANAAGSRQLVHRARRKLAGERPPDVVRGDELAGVVDAFVNACATGEIDALLRVLAPDVVLVSDGGAERHAARRPVVGAGRVARLVLFVARRIPDGCEVVRAVVNGDPAVVVRWGDRPVVVVTMEAGVDGVRRIRQVVAPSKLTRLGVAVKVV